MAFKTGSSDSTLSSTSNTSLCDALWSIDYNEKDALTATTTTPAHPESHILYENRIISPTLLSIAARHPIYVAGTLTITHLSSTCFYVKIIICYDSQQWPC